jgi:uncharacterized protein (DUF2267 family)
MHGFQGLPGTVEPDELDGREEWVPAGGSFERSLEARLGSDARVAKLVLAALPPLRHHLAPDTWDAVADDLSWELRGMLASAAAHLGGPVPRLETADAYARFLGLHTGHAHARAALHARSVLGALKESVAPGLADAIAAELPGELAALWRDAR